MELREGRGRQSIGVLAWSVQAAVSGELGEGLGIWVLVAKTAADEWGHTGEVL